MPSDLICTSDVAAPVQHTFGRLEYLSCPFTTAEAVDSVHRDRVRDAYRVCWSYIRTWLIELVELHGWTCSLDQEDGAALQSGESDRARTLMVSVDGKQTLMLPHTATQFLSADAQYFYKEMFGKFEVQYEAASPNCNGQLQPHISNAPAPIGNIVSLLQCALPGQLFFAQSCPKANLGLTTVDRLCAYPSREWCLTHWDKVVSITISRLALSGSHNEVIFAAASAIREFTTRHHYIDLRGRSCSIHQTQVYHPVPFRYTSRGFPERSTTPEPTVSIALGKRTRDFEDALSDRSPSTPKRARSESVPYLSSGESPSSNSSPMTPATLPSTPASPVDTSPAYEPLPQLAYGSIWTTTPKAHPYTAKTTSASTGQTMYRSSARGALSTTPLQSRDWQGHRVNTFPARRPVMSRYAKASFSPNDIKVPHSNPAGHVQVDIRGFRPAARQQRKFPSRSKNEVSGHPYPFRFQRQIKNSSFR